MELDRINKVYFLGIGGIGMSALARFFNQSGIKVFGYDRISTSLTSELIKEGIAIHFEEQPDQIHDDIDLVIYTPAIPVENTEFQYVKSRNFPLLKRSEVLGMLTHKGNTIAIAGTHGKTSITSLITHLLISCGKNPTAFIGGVSKNLNSNFITKKDSSLFIVEADEFDRSFLKLKPDIGIISSIDTDHLDIYRTKDKLIESFNSFASQVKDSGVLIHHHNVKLPHPECKYVYTYGIDEKADLYANNIRIEDNIYIFDIIVRNNNEVKLNNLKFSIPGKYNIENLLAAVAVAIHLKADPKDLRRAIQEYQGVKRRFEYIIKTKEIIFIDDYAHHPVEITSCINAVKEIYPKKKITGIFQPHLYSRTRDLADEFAKSLELLDELILLDIYPAREQPIKGISSELILNKVKLNNKIISDQDKLIELLDHKNIEVLITLGAGDIDQIVKPIKELLESQLKLKHNLIP